MGILLAFQSYGSIFRLAEAYWKEKAKASPLILDGSAFSKEVDKGSQSLYFEYKKEIDLGEYQYVSIEMSSDEEGELVWGWKSKRSGNQLLLYPQSMTIIPDGKVHTYTYYVLILTDVPFFDVAESLILGVKGLLKRGTGEKLKLERVMLQPYAESRPRQVAINEISMDVLCDKKIEIEQVVPPKSKLVFYTGIIYKEYIAKKFLTPEKSSTLGMKFIIQTKVDDKDETIFQSEMNPIDKPEDRSWRRTEIDLTRYENKKVKFKFLMDFLGDDAGDYGFWGNPMIISERGRESQVSPPIFIISCDTLRPDHLLPYGYDLPTSPYLDEFAKDGVVFENAYTTQPFTPVAHMSLLSGLYPENHGVTSNSNAFLHVRTVAEILRECGYQTAGFTGFRWWFLPSRGFSRGMDFFSIPGISEGERRSVFKVHEDAKKWIRNTKEKQLFVFLHNYDIHSVGYKGFPYNAEEERFKMFSRAYESPSFLYPGCEDISSGTLFLFHAALGDINLTEAEIKYIQALYDDCIVKVDYALGDFFSFLKHEGLYDPALIVVVSDHGESLGEHGFFNHDNNVYQENIKVVMMVKFPYQEYAGLRIKGNVILEDIVPTILDLLNYKNSMSLDGISLMNLIEGKEVNRDFIFSTNSSNKMRAIIKGGYKFLEDIKVGKMSLFDLSRDEHENFNLKDKEYEVFWEMKEIFNTQFGLRKEGWWLCFSNPVLFWTGSVNIQCSVPILFSKIQGGVLRTKNERTTPMELKADVFLPKSSLPAIIQIVPVEDKSELKIHIQNCSLMNYPSEYHVLQSKDERLFYFSSEDMKIQGTNSSDDKKGFSFWVEYYSKGTGDGRKVIDMTEETKETLRNLGYLD